jgi:hypothetical protein
VVLGHDFFHHGVCYATEMTDTMVCGQGTLRKGGTSRFLYYLRRNWYFNFRAPRLFLIPPSSTPPSWKHHHNPPPLVVLLLAPGATNQFASLLVPCLHHPGCGVPSWQRLITTASTAQSPSDLITSFSFVPDRRSFPPPSSQHYHLMLLLLLSSSPLVDCCVVYCILCCCLHCVHLTPHWPLLPNAIITASSCFAPIV